MRGAMRIAAICAAAFGPSPVLSEPLETFDPGVVTRCIDTNGGAECIGQAASLCMTADGASQPGPCLGAETAAWQALLDEAMQIWAERPLPNGVSLEQLNADFQTYRSRICDFETAVWDGMHTGPVTQACLMRATALHVLWLRSLEPRP